jgi:hypothetical protein
MEPAQDGEPRFLHHLLCHRKVPHEHPRQAEHARLIPIDQRDEGQLVACAQRLKEVCFISGVRRTTPSCLRYRPGTALLSLAQRRLSTPVRALRRRAVTVTGQVSYRDGLTQPIGAPTLIAVPEGALRLLWPAAVLMSAGVLGARWL